MPRAMVGSTMGIVFLPVGKSAHFFVGDLFLRGPRANRGQKKSYGRFPGKKTYCNNQPHIIYSHRPQPSSTPPSPSTNKLYSFAVVHHRPPLSTAARCHPLPSTAIPCRLFPRPPLSAAHLVVICPQRICRYLSPPLHSKFVAANDSVSCLILLRPDNDNEEETRSPSSPVAPDAHRIIGRSAADDSMPFYYIATR